MTGSAETAGKPGADRPASGIESEQITGLILAGGQGRRMGTVDKGLQPFRGYPMVMHVILRLGPQVGPLLINANQNLPAYESLGHAVLPDEIQGYAGPLAGLHAGLKRCETAYLLSAPCDSPFLPADLAQRLAAGLLAQDAELAVAWTGTQAHPVFCLMRAGLAPHLEAFLQQGGRKVDAWTNSLRVANVFFDDEADAFRNINTVEELKHFEVADALPGTVSVALPGKLPGELPGTVQSAPQSEPAGKSR